MKYIELRDQSRGKEFVRTRDGKVITRTQVYFDYSGEEIRLGMLGHDGIFMLRDKEDWKDGIYTDPDARTPKGEKNLSPVESDEQ